MFIRHHKSLHATIWLELREMTVKRKLPTQGRKKKEKKQERRTRYSDEREDNWITVVKYIHRHSDKAISLRVSSRAQFNHHPVTRIESNQPHHTVPLDTVKCTSYRCECILIGDRISSQVNRKRKSTLHYDEPTWLMAPVQEEMTRERSGKNCFLSLFSFSFSHKKNYPPRGEAATY